MNKKRFEIIISSIYLVVCIVIIILSIGVSQEAVEFFELTILVITMFFLFTSIGYSSIKNKNFSKIQKIFFIMFLLVMGLVDLILLFITSLSGIGIDFIIFGIFNAIFLGVLGIFFVVFG